MTREEAIEHLKNIAIYSIQDGYTNEARQALDMAIKALEEPPWIPCSERVPEEDEQVLVYLYDSPYIAWIDSNGAWNTAEFTLDKEKEREDEPIAWMPLPEPYKERREE